VLREIEDLEQVAAAHEAHREVDAALLVDAELVQRDDARVVELAGDARLLEEAGERDRIAAGRAVLVLRARRARDLHRQRAAEIGVLHAVDDAHPAAADLLLEHVAVVGLLGGELLQAGARAADVVLRVRRGAVLDGLRQSGEQRALDLRERPLRSHALPVHPIHGRFSVRGKAVNPRAAARSRVTARGSRG
jgi:hypothetical protein